MRRFLYLVTKKCRIYAACGVSQTPSDIYPRKELNLQEREMITITSLLTAGGCEPQLEVHINGSLNVGIAPENIIETFIQCIPYTGFPKVLNAIFVAKKIFAERGITFEK